jgi:hypothetical protein
MGRRSVDRAGVVELEARMISNLGTDVSVEVDRLATPQPVSLRARSAKPPIKIVRGTIDRFVVGANGEIDGARLGNGRRIQWSSNVAQKIKSAIGEGDEVEVSGTLETIAESPVLKVVKIGNLRTGTVAVDDALASPPATHTYDDKLQRRLDALQEQLNSIQVEIDRLRTLPPASVD